jgi:hypothetical protein
MNWFQAALNCKYYGGFSRERMWEAIVTFDKNKCELPYETEIERMLEWLGVNFAVDTLDATITHNVLAFFYRIDSLSNRFGQPPNRLRSRLSEYHEEVVKNKNIESVERYTGMRVSPETVMQLYETVKHLKNELGGSHNHVRELMDSLQKTQASLDRSNMVILQTRDMVDQFLSETRAQWQNLRPLPPPPSFTPLQPSPPSPPASPPGSPPLSPRA